VWERAARQPITVPAIPQLQSMGRDVNGTSFRLPKHERRYFLSQCAGYSSREGFLRLLQSLIGIEMAVTLAEAFR
jgi:hypothetical protein